MAEKIQKTTVIGLLPLGKSLKMHTRHRVPNFGCIYAQFEDNSTVKNVSRKPWQRAIIAKTFENIP